MTFFELGQIFLIDENGTVSGGVDAPFFPVTKSVHASGYVNVPLLDPLRVLFGAVFFFSFRGAVPVACCVRRFWFGFLSVGVPGWQPKETEA